MTAVEEGAGTPAAGGARRLDPRIVKVWTVEDAAWSAVLVVLALAADLGARVAGVDPPWPPGLAALPVAIVVGILTWKLPRARFRYWSYEVAPDALELRHGVLERVHSAIPYYRVQYVDINQGPVERALGLARLRVHTAAASSDATIPGIAAGEADALRQVILERTGSGDAV